MEGDNVKSDIRTSENKTSGETSFDLNSLIKNNTAGTNKNNTSTSNTDKNKIPNRNIIKLGPDANDNKTDLKLDKNKDTTPNTKDLPKDAKTLEYKINKNENGIKAIEEKLSSLSEDVEDLISLYEIVSVEMNPFVGLSKITLKRLEALENMDREFENIKHRLEEMEISGGQRMSRNDYIEKQNEDEYEMNQEIDVDEIIESALDEIMERNSLDNVIDQFIRGLRNNMMPSLT